MKKPDLSWILVICILLVVAALYFLGSYYGIDRGINFVYEKQTVFVLKPLVTMVVANVVYQFVKLYALERKTKWLKFVLRVQCVAVVFVVFAVRYDFHFSASFWRLSILFSAVVLYACSKGFAQQEINNKLNRLQFLEDEQFVEKLK